MSAENVISFVAARGGCEVAVVLVLVMWLLELKLWLGVILVRGVSWLSPCVFPVSLQCCFVHVHQRRCWLWPRVLALAC